MITKEMHIWDIGDLFCTVTNWTCLFHSLTNWTCVFCSLTNWTLFRSPVGFVCSVVWLTGLVWSVISLDFFCSSAHSTSSFVVQLGVLNCASSFNIFKLRLMLNICIFGPDVIRMYMVEWVLERNDLHVHLSLITLPHSSVLPSSHPQTHALQETMVSVCNIILFYYVTYPICTTTYWKERNITVFLQCMRGGQVHMYPGMKQLSACEIC